MERTMSQIEKANVFRVLHVKGRPLILYNIWDAGGARAVAQADAKAIATGSMSVAAAHGYSDGEAIPLDFLLSLVTRIVAAVDLPVTVDFEGAYAADPDTIRANVARLIRTGAIGLNFEDQVVGGSGLYPVEVQAARIAAVRAAAKDSGVPMFINARTDLFLQAGDGGDHATLVTAAISRGRRYAEAGADCFFVPLLGAPELVAEVVAGVDLPVNVMVLDTGADLAPLAAAGVARVSFGPAPYLAGIRALTEAAGKFL
jgi:2-methylisocitrate lyase-like PEP mutase family enzyme